MTTITYVEDDGRRTSADVKTGLSVMEGALLNGVDGIEAQCGGNAMCGTCHVFVDPAFVDRLPPPSEDEETMLLGTATESTPLSRLSCQLKVTDALQGLVVHIAARQV